MVDGAGDENDVNDAVSVPSTMSDDGACVSVVLRLLSCSLDASDHMQMHGSWLQMKQTNSSSTSSQ